MWNGQDEGNFETCLGLEPRGRVMHEEVKRVGSSEAAGRGDGQVVLSAQNNNVKRNKKSGSVGRPELADC